jgi:molybdopterin molybdotransferase
MIEVEEAQRRVLDEVGFLGSEEVGLQHTLGRILAEQIASTHDVPQADNSAMDGYAVRASDCAEGAALSVSEDVPAGSVARGAVLQGTAIRIMTGAPVPEGADAVVPVEWTDGGSERVVINRSVASGANIRRRGEDMRRGEVVLGPGTLIGPGEIGVLAGAQRARVLVGRRPTVAILSTGDEVIEIEGELSPGKVVNSNSWSLAALARQAGALARPLGIVPDRREATVRAIEDALDSDFIVSSGGVSVGAYDFVKDALEELGAETKFWNVAMKPGKPVVLSRLRDRLYFGLPGNPVSCMVAFLLFVAPAIRKAMGASQILAPLVRMKTAGVMKSRGDRRVYMRVRVEASDGELTAHPKPAQGSGVSTSMVGANGLAIIPHGVREIAPGDMVDVVLFDSLV